MLRQLWGFNEVKQLFPGEWFLQDGPTRGEVGTWCGLGPDDSPLILRDVGSQEIYALDLQLP